VIRQHLFLFVDKLSRQEKKLLFALIDILLAPIAFLASWMLLYEALPNSAFFQQFWPAAIALQALAGAATVALKLPNIRLNSYEIWGILRTGFMALLVTLAFAAFVGASTLVFPRLGIILFGLIFFPLAVGARFALLHVLLWILGAGKQRQRVIIYGAGRTGMQLLAALRNHRSIRPVAFIDDNPELRSMSVGGLPVCHSDRIAELAQRYEARRVLLAMPSVPAMKLAQIARKLQAMGMTAMSVPSFAQLVGVEKLVDTLAPIDPDKFLGRAQIEKSIPAAEETYQGKTILISGAGGSVGTALCQQLLAHKPACIVLFEISEIALYTVERALAKLANGTDVRIIPVLGSVGDGRLARAIMSKYNVDIVFHAAAYKHVPLVEANPIAGLANNVLGTRTLADAANAASVEKFVLISTDKAVRPTNIMGASKRLAELVIQDLAKRPKSTVFSIVRFGNVLGSSGSVIPLFKEQIANGEPVTLTHEDVTRFFMTIPEAARLVLLAGAFSDGSMGGGDVFVLDMGAPVRIRDLARQMIEAAGLTVRDAEHPEGDIPILVTGLRPGEKLHEELLIGAKLITTPHPKILRAHEQSLTELQMASALRALRAAVSVGDAEAARNVVVAYADGYHSEERLSAAQ
jgi:FlaA1/EpsC-like NDP-sugar epimerase